MRWTPLLCMLACTPLVPPSAYGPHSLVPGRVTTDVEYEGFRRDWRGDIGIEGSQGNWQINATVEGAGVLEFEVRTPTGADLSVLHGIKNGQVSLYEEAVSGDLSIGVSDDAGVVYLQETVEASDMSTQLLGPGFLRQGTNLGDVSLGETSLTLSSVVLTTAQGLVEAYPGYPIEIELLDNFYQFTLMANWVRTYSPSSDLFCDFDQVLAYELVRVERGTVDITPLTRGANQDIDGNGICIPGGGPF